MSIVQVCYVVRDLNAACHRFNALYNLGPFVGGSQFTLHNHIYRGRPAEPIDLQGVFVQSGTIVVELLQVLSTGPNAFTDMFAPGEEGLHHTAQFCGNYAAERDRLVADGAPVASSFTAPFGAEICYVDTRATLGHMIELYPEHPVIRDMYRVTQEASLSWAGGDLIVPWPA